MAEARTRPATPADLEALRGIYNHYVLNTPISFDIEPRSVEDRREWMSHYASSGPHRLLVAEVGGEVVGYASSSAFRTRAAYRTSVEVTIYLHPEHMGRGLGRLLYGALFDALSREDLHRAYAGITLPNAASESLHRGFGFREVGVFREVGRKSDRYWDVLWLEKDLD